MIHFRLKSADEEAFVTKRSGIVIVDITPSLERAVTTDPVGQREGIIIVDITPSAVPDGPMARPAAPFEISARVERLDLEFSQSRMALVHIDQTPLTPQVFENASGFNFDPEKQQLELLDREGGPALTVDTSRDTALISVNFSTSTITAYVHSGGAVPGTMDTSEDLL